MRAVLDTNVVVSALIWGGIPFALLEAATEERAVWREVARLDATARGDGGFGSTGVSGG